MLSGSLETPLKVEMTLRTTSEDSHSDLGRSQSGYVRKVGSILQNCFFGFQ